jgi:hypothetical protein
MHPVKRTVVFIKLAVKPCIYIVHMGNDPCDDLLLSHVRVQEEDDFALRRFLRARDHNISKATSMLLQYLSWKRSTKPHGFISDDEVRGEIAKNRDHMQGFDRMGRPLVYLYAARHFPVRRDFEELKLYVSYVLDKICTRYPYRSIDS